MSTNMKDTRLFKEEFFLILFISILLIWAVGFRPESVGSDTSGYIDYFERHSLGREYLFQLISSTVGAFSLPVGVFFSSIALIDFLLLAFLARQLVAFDHCRIELNYLLLLLGTCFFASPFFFASIANVLRHGTAIFALFIFYVALISRSNLLLLIPPLMIAMGFHRTSIIAITFSPLIFLSYRAVFYSVLFACFLYLSGLSEKLLWLVSKLSPTDFYLQISTYANGALSGYHMGRRLDFTLFSLLAGMSLNFMGNRFLSATDKINYTELVKIYWVLILPFFFFGFAAYSDRYLLSGWLFLSVLSAVLLGHLFKKRPISSYWLYCVFIATAICFFLKVQGLLVFNMR